MSDIVEKTLASFPKFLSEGLLGVGSNQTRPNKHDVPSGLRQLMSAVHAARSKSDEDLLIKKEISFLQQRFSQPNQSNQQVRETYSRLLFCLTLGYDVSFATIHTVKLAQQGSGMQKRLGYLLSCLLLHENHEMLILLINTIQKDLKSSNLLDNCMGLIAASQLLNSENIPMFLPLVLEKLKHQRELVRIKAAQCLHHFYLKAPSMMVHAHTNFQKALCDKDPGVLRGIVQIYIQLAKSSPSEYHHLGTSFLGILTQIINRSFPALHEYHSVPLPWLQILLLKVLGSLGVNNDELKNEMFPVLKAVIQKATVKHNIAFAVLYECILTVAKIKGDKELLSEASTCVAKFLGSSSNTLKYLGIKALTALVSVSSEYAVQHQIAVVECLDGEELTTQRKTLELLFRMSNQSNVKAICSKLFEHLKRTDDGYFKQDMAGKIAELAERFAPDIRWYVETVNAVIAESSVNSVLADKLMDKLDAELHTVDDEEFEKFLATSYLPYIENGTSPSSLLKLGLWVFGELRAGLRCLKPARIVAVVCTPLSVDGVDVCIQSAALSSLLKLVVKGVLEAGIVREWFTHHKYTFRLPQLQQKYQEVVRLVSHSDQSCQLSRFQNGNRKKQYDFTLSFLDDYVCTSLETSGSPYRPLGVRMITSRRDDQAENDGFSALYQEIISPGAFGSQRSSVRTNSFTASNTSEGSDRTGEEGQNRDTGLKMSGVKRVWGREGYIGGESDHTHAQGSNTQSREKGGPGSDVTRKKQLAQALFEGINMASDQQGYRDTGQNQTLAVKSGSDGSSGSSGWVQVESYLPSSDSSGWRAYSAKHTVNIDTGHTGEQSSEFKNSEAHSGQDIDSDGPVVLGEQRTMFSGATSSRSVTSADSTVMSSTPSVMSSTPSVMSSPPSVMSSEAVVTSIMSSSVLVGEGSANQGTLQQSSQSERREIWLANEGSPQHVQYDSLYNSKVPGGDTSSDGHSSVYNDFTNEVSGRKAVVVDKSDCGNSDEAGKANSMYSEYYSSQS